MRTFLSGVGWGGERGTVSNGQPADELLSAEHSEWKRVTLGMVHVKTSSAVGYPQRLPPPPPSSVKFKTVYEA